MNTHFATSVEYFVRFVYVLCMFVYVYVCFVYVLCRFLCRFCANAAIPCVVSVEFPALKAAMTKRHKKRNGAKSREKVTGAEPGAGAGADAGAGAGEAMRQDKAAHGAAARKSRAERGSKRPRSAHGGTPSRTSSTLAPKPGKRPRQARASSSRAGSGLLNRFQKKLQGGQFRWLNEQLYTSTGTQAFAVYQSDTSLFDAVRGRAVVSPGAPLVL